MLAVALYGDEAVSFLRPICAGLREDELHGYTASKGDGVDSLARVACAAELRKDELYADEAHAYVDNKSGGELLAGAVHATLLGDSVDVQ